METYTAHFAALVENLNIKTQLQEAKDQYHSLVEATPNIILTHTLDGTITYINENGAELFGLDQTLIVGQNLNALLGEKQSIKFAENMKELLSYKQGERLKKETKIEINSRIKDFELVGTLLYADTEADEVLLYATDITDRKMADDKLKESEEKFRTIFEHSPVMIDAFDKNGKCILWNKECENKLGYTLEEINQSENPITLFYPDANIREAVLKTIIKKPDKRFREWNPITKNGEKLPSLWANFRISDEFIISIGLDISKRKEAEEALLLSEARFKALHNASFGGITIHDKGVILECNKGLSEITGYETEELIGMDGLLLIAEESRDMVMDHITSGYEKPYEAVGIRKNGEKYPLRLEGRQIPYQGKIVRVVEFRDITKQKKIEFALIEAKEKAEESDRLKSAFLSNMSHEIRTPMNGILGFTELLKEPGLSGDEQEKYIEIIRKSGERMLDTVNDIIDISKIDAGQMEVASNNVNIQEESGYLYEFFKGEAFSKGLEMSFTNKLSEGDSFILTDRLKVISIISNLIKNAIKYTDEGTINVFCSRQESQLVVKVSDTGIGISKERVDSIFNRFEQADISDVHAREGSGLGLSISQAYAEMLGGEITVESEPGKGSVFILSLPWTQHHDVVKSTRERMETTTVEDIHTAKILIVEDDDTSFEHLSILVGSVSKYVVRAENGKDAVDFVRNNNVDLILMDIKLPIMTGYEATKEIRKFNMDVIIIAQTAYALSGERDTALAAGCNDYISKPIDKNQLLKLMKKYL